MVVVSPEVREALAAHLRAELPNEGCGLLLSFRIAASIPARPKNYGNAFLLVENRAGEISADFRLIVRMSHDDQKIRLEARVWLRIHR